MTDSAKKLFESSGQRQTQGSRFRHLMISIAGDQKMKVLIHDKKRMLDPRGFEWAESKILSALSKFGPKISRVDLSVSDVNGGRGGVDQKCRLTVRLKKLDDVVVAELHRSLTQAISIAASRVERSVARRLDKKTRLPRRVASAVPRTV